MRHGYAMLPKQDMIGWRGNHIMPMDFAEHANQYDSPFWDFHRASPQQVFTGTRPGRRARSQYLDKLEGGWRRVGRGGRRVHGYSARREEVRCGFGCGY